jgi:peptidoglycan biosynthesis protein MviN/MurJ (putative lipid II flippase)
MVGIDTIVYIIVALLIGGLILGLLWWLITYCEKQFPGFPLVFKVIKVVFVILVVLMLISLLMHLAGYPLVRFDARPMRA